MKKKQKGLTFFQFVGLLLFSTIAGCFGVWYLMSLIHSFLY